MAQVKGTAVQYLRERFAEPALAGVVAALPEPDPAVSRETGSR